MVKVKSLRDETSGHPCIEILNIQSQDCRFHVGNVSYRSQLCLTLWDLMDGSLPDSSVHGIIPARILEWVAVFFSR